MTPSASAGPLTGRSLLAVFAHPDDESLACGGLLARCAALGARVSLLCATRGEWGPSTEHRTSPATGAPAEATPTPESRAPSPASRAPGPESRAPGPESRAPRPESRPIAEIRTRELEAAARVLGVADLVILDNEDGMLPWVNAGRMEADIRDTISRSHPHVVITFGEDGLYWHPDHIAVHERTTAAVAALGVDAPALYYVTMPPGRMRAVVDTVAARMPGRSRLRILGIEDADAFGALAAAPTLVIEAGAFATRKLAAIKCHRSQLDGDALDMLSEADAIRLLGTEHFRRAAAGSQDDAFIEHFAASALPHASSNSTPLNHGVHEGREGHEDG